MCVQRCLAVTQIRVELTNYMVMSFKNNTHTFSISIESFDVFIQFLAIFSIVLLSLLAQK